MVIEANPAPFSAFKQTATVTTNANGSYSATVKPLVITRYRATAKTSPPTVSSEVVVRVRIRVGLVLRDATPRRGAKVVFSGRAHPAHDGALVSIKKRTSTGSFATIARTRLLDDGTARSRYRRTVRIRRSGVYRVSVSSNDSDHLSGVSRTQDHRPLVRRRHGGARGTASPSIAGDRSLLANPARSDGWQTGFG